LSFHATGYGYHVIEWADIRIEFPIHTTGYGMWCGVIISVLGNTVLLELPLISCSFMLWEKAVQCLAILDVLLSLATYRLEPLWLAGCVTTATAILVCLRLSR
jgi:hypothetical protein